MADKRNDMQQEQEPNNICYLKDEKGKEHRFEVIADCMYKDTVYYAMIPALNSEMEQEFCEYVILKEIVKNGEVNLESVDDDDEFNAVAAIFDDMFDEEIDYDDNNGAGKK